MPMPARTVAFCIFACVALFIAAASRPAAAAADVVCSPFVPHTRVVGNKAVDTSCDDDSIQSAINNTVCPNTTVYLTAERDYTGQHVTIQDKSLTIFGSTATSCSGGGIGAAGAQAAAPTAPVATITGNGSQSVFDISGTSNVTFQYVEITGGGGGAGSHGGGIDFVGAGSLTIDTSTIDLNHANFGGGIEMNGSGGSATLTLNAYSVIESNTASGNGGGVNIEGTARLTATAPFTTIGLNHAPNGKGGGIAVVGPAQADIGSPGYVEVPVLNGNDAALGGALSVQAVNDAQPGYANLFTTDPAHPVAVVGNFASQAGGAIYVKPHSSLFGDLAPAYAAAVEARLDGNAAPEGAAVYLDNDAVAFGTIGSSVFYFNNGLVGAAVGGAVPCGSDVVCNTISGNQTVDGANQPTAGAVIFTNGDAQAFMFRVAMRSNAGAHALRLLDDVHEIGKCLIADNAFGAETIRVEHPGAGGSLTVDSCTIANNAHNSGSVIYTEDDLTLTHSILDQPAMSSLDTNGGPSVNAHFVLAADPTGLPAQEDIVQGEPLFVDPDDATVARRDYHQVAYIASGSVTSSYGIDFAPAVSGDDRDLDGNPYDQDVPAAPDHLGDRDLGCYEAQPIADRVFADAFGDPVWLVLP
jgi:hypothetical protein